MTGDISVLGHRSVKRPGKSQENKGQFAHFSQSPADPIAGTLSEPGTAVGLALSSQPLKYDSAEARERIQERGRKWGQWRLCGLLYSKYLNNESKENIRQMPNPKYYQRQMEVIWESDTSDSGVKKSGLFQIAVLDVAGWAYLESIKVYSMPHIIHQVKLQMPQSKCMKQYF